MNRLTRITRHVNDGCDEPTSSLKCQPTAASPIVEKLKGKIAALVKVKAAEKADLLKKHGDTKIQDVTVEMCVNGARGMKTMVTETSDLDAQKGIAYRGLSLFDCNKQLPKAPGGEAALPEAAFWLLLTGEVPSEEDV